MKIIFTSKPEISLMKTKPEEISTVYTVNICMDKGRDMQVAQTQREKQEDRPASRSFMKSE